MAIAAKKLVIIFILLASVAWTGLFPTARAEPVYTLGVVPQFETRRLHQIWQPILDYLEDATGHRFKLLGSPTIPAFETEFLYGKFDFVYMNPYHMATANEKAGYIPLVRDVAKELHGVLVVRKDSNTAKVMDLQGKNIAFPAPNALGASLLIRKELTDRFNLQFLPRYVKTHDSVYLNVLLGEVAAGGGVQKTLQRQPEEFQQQLEVIHKTSSFAPHPIAVHPDVPPAVASAVLKALLDLGKLESGKTMLKKIPIGTIGKATIEDYQPLREMGLERFVVGAPTDSP